MLLDFNAVPEPAHHFLGKAYVAVYPRHIFSLKPFRHSQLVGVQLHLAGTV